MPSSRHITLKIFLSLIGLIVLMFVGQVVYYLWQFRYGDEETLRTITQTYSDQFSKISDADAPNDYTNYTNLVKNHNPVTGKSDAPITVTAFIDFGCPYSQENYPVFSYIQEQFNPAVRVVFKHLPLTQIHPDALPAALAATCAQEQNKFWEYHNVLFQSRDLSQTALYNDAQALGLNMAQFDSCYTSQRYLTNIQQDIEDAIDVGVRGTPTILINEEVVEGVSTQDDWNARILSHLN